MMTSIRTLPRISRDDDEVPETRMHDRENRVRYHEMRVAAELLEKERAKSLPEAKYIASQVLHERSGGAVRVVEFVCKQHGIEPKSIGRSGGSRRTARHTQARILICWALRSMDFSYPMIKEQIGLLSHSSAIWMFKRAVDLYGPPPGMKAAA